jgi:Ca2+:H+ antiporter
MCQLINGLDLQDGTSHYLKGILLLLCYIVIGACFFVARQPAGMFAFVKK